MDYTPAQIAILDAIAGAPGYVMTTEAIAPLGIASGDPMAWYAELVALLDAKVIFADVITDAGGSRVGSFYAMGTVSARAWRASRAQS